MDAVIDIGSNSVRLFVESGKAVTPKKLNTTQLAQGLANTGKLNNEAMVRTADAVANFFVDAKNAGAGKVYIFGTEAMRCPGGETLKDMIFRRIGVETDIVSGDEEALLGYMGATDCKGSNAVLDIGGASVELIVGKDDDIIYKESLPLGVVRVKDCVGSDRREIEKYYSQQITAYKKERADRLIGIGGTATSLASMILKQQVYDADAIHGAVLTRGDIKNVTDVIFNCKDIIALFPTIGAKRAGVIGHGAVLTGLIMDYLGYDSITVSERDNAEGYLLYRRRPAACKQ